MLVLSRRRDETIVIGGNVEVTVVDIKGDTVRLGINAPREIDIHRKEIFLAIQKENIAAAKAGGAPDLKALGKMLGSKEPPNESRRKK